MQKNDCPRSNFFERPNASEHVQTRPNTSADFETIANISKNPETNRKKLTPKDGFFARTGSGKGEDVTEMEFDSQNDVGRTESLTGKPPLPPSHGTST